MAAAALTTLGNMIGSTGAVANMIDRIKSTASVSAMNLGPAEVDPGWSKMNMHVKNIQLAGIRTQEGLDRVLGIFSRQIARWVGVSNAAELTDMNELLDIIRLNAFSMGRDDKEHVWVFDIKSKGSTADLALVTLMVSTSGRSGVCVKWMTLDGSVTVAPTTRIMQCHKSNIFKSKSWSEVITIPRNTAQEDVMGLLDIACEIAKIAKDH